MKRAFGDARGHRETIKCGGSNGNASSDDEVKRKLERGRRRWTGAKTASARTVTTFLLTKEFSFENACRVTPHN